MREGVTTHDGFIRLHRHVHQARYHAAGAVNLGRVDVGDDLTLLVALEDHGDLLQRGVTGTLTDTVDRDLHLAGSVQDKNLIGAILQIISDFRLDLSSKHTLFRYNSYRKFTLFSKNAQLEYTLFSRTLCTSVPDLYQTRKVDNFSFPIFSWQSILQDSLLEPGSLHKTGTVLPS